ncbi:MAG: preprotein translocase subunit YajC [Gemmatimonadales bacterium]
MNTILSSIMARPEGQGGGMSFLIIQLGLIALVFYFLIIRPQSQARKRHEALLEDLKKGDEVVTSGGVMGKVTDIKDARITIETGTAQIVVLRQRITQVGDAVAPGARGR